MNKITRVTVVSICEFMTLTTDHFRDRGDTVERREVKVPARFDLTGGEFSCIIMGMTYLFGLSLLILALWLASEIAARDLASPTPKDPYRLDRWREGEGDPDP